MAGYTTTKGNFVQLNVFSTTTDPSLCLAYTLWNDMIANGFSIVAQDNSSTPDATKLNQTKIIILKPSTDIDPLWATNNWYIGFKIVDRAATLTNNNQSGTQTYNNTELQIISFGVSKDDPVPSIVSTTGSDGTTVKEISQNAGLYVPILPGLKYPIAKTGKPTITTDPTTGKQTATPTTDMPPRIWTQQPYAYVLSIVKRGFVLSIYDQTLDNMNYNGVYCVQRGVDKTGTMRSDGNTPLYCVTNVVSRRKYYAAADITDNSDNIPSNNHNIDNSMIVNSTVSNNQTQISSDAAKQLLYPHIDFTRNEEQGPGPTSMWYGYTLRESDDIIYDIYENVLQGFKKFQTGQYQAWTSLNAAYYDEFNYPMVDTTLSYPLPYTGKYLHHFPSFWDGPVTADNGDYLLILPYGLCTKRFAYTDEVDLVGVSKADAYQKLQQISINLYSQDRTYSALPSNNEVASTNGHSGIRSFILTDGPDFH